MYISSMKSQRLKLKQWWRNLESIVWRHKSKYLTPHCVLHYQHPVVRSGMNCLETAFNSGVHNLYNQALLAYVYGLAGREERRQFFLEQLDGAAVRAGKCSMAVAEAVQLMEWPVGSCELFWCTVLSGMLSLPLSFMPAMLLNLFPGVLLSVSFGVTKVWAVAWSMKFWNNLGW